MPLNHLQSAAPADALPCQTTAPELWFADNPAEVERAKALCGGCALRLECLAGALLRQEEAGIWGGEIFWRGAVVADRPRRGRPRKRTAAPLEERQPA